MSHEADRTAGVRVRATVSGRFVAVGRCTCGAPVIGQGGSPDRARARQRFLQRAHRLGAPAATAGQL